MAGEKILIIDDSDALRSLLESILPFAGYQAISASNGREGLALVERARPDVILTDLELPDMNGLKILEDLNERGITIPTIMMTGYGSEGIAARALQLGVRDYLIKPFTTEEVLASIERALVENRLRRENQTLDAQLTRYNRHIRLISAVGRAAASNLKVDTFLQRIAEASSYAAHADSGRVLLLDETQKSLRMAAGCGQIQPHPGLFSLDSADEELQPVLQAEEVVRLHAPANPNIELQTGEKVGAVLQVPLSVRGQVCGLLSVARHSSSAPFDKHDEWMLLILASYASMVLARAPQTNETRAVGHNHVADEASR